ncbi:MAG: YfhO family protein [Candidatus Hydrogenedentota bacterium]
MHRHITWKELCVVALAFLAVLAAFFPRVFLQGETTLPGGLVFDSPPWNRYVPEDHRPVANWLAQEHLVFFRVWYHIGAEAIRNGDWPLWNHLQLAGMPLLANYQSAMLYPPKLLLAILDVDVASTLLMLSKLWFCGMTAYYFARRTGLLPVSAAFAAIAFMVGGYNITWFYWVDGDVIAWLPLLLLGVELVLQSSYRRGFFGISAAAVLMLLGGHPESAFTIGMSAGVYFILRIAFARQDRKAVLKSVLTAGGAWLLALCIAAPQIVPFLEYLPLSVVRGGKTPDPHALPPENLVAWWVPRFFGFGDPTQGDSWGKYNSTFATSTYVGIITWFGVALLFATRKLRPAQRHRVYAMGAAVALNFLLAYNWESLHPVHNLPVLNSMWRYWHISFSMFALPYLGATGIDRWLRGRSRVRGLLWPAALAIGAGLAVYGLFAFNRKVLEMQGHADFVRLQIIAAALFAVLGLGALASCLWMRRKEICGALILAVLLAEFGFAARDMLPTAPIQWLNTETKLTQYLQDLPKPHRLHTLSTRVRTGLFQPYGLEQWWGYDAMFPRRIRTFAAQLDPDFWISAEPACALSHYLHRVDYTPLFPLDEPGRFTQLTELDGIAVYQNNRALPRAYIVSTAQIVSDEDELFAFMRSKDFDPKRQVLLQEKPPGWLVEHNEAPQKVAGTARVTERTSTRVKIQTETEAPGILVLADAFYPGWKAYIDGQKTAIFPANYAFRGIVVPAGTHEVRFEYGPVSFFGGLALSIAAMVISLPVALMALRKQVKA